MSPGWDPADDTPRSLTELARCARLARTTLVNWLQRDHPPVLRAATRNGRPFVSWKQLVEYCQAHPELRGAQKVIRALQADTASPEPAEHLDIEGALAIARNMRAAAEQIFEALVASAQQAEDLARSHREQLQRLRAVIGTYDDALLQFTATRTQHD